MTFADLRADVGRRLQLSTTLSTADTTRINAALNHWHRRVLSEAGFRALRRVQITQASVANQIEYAVALAEIHHITQRTNQWRLTKRTEDWWRHTYPDPTADTGTPDSWVPLGFSRVAARPANASELFVISTDAGDTGVARVEVIRSAGYQRLLNVTMTGVTGVSLGAAITDVVDVLDFYVSVAAVGTITLREDSGTGAVLATIPIGATRSRYVKYALAPTPSAVITHYLDGVAPSTDMVQDVDESLFPIDDFDLILSDGAVYDDWLQHGRLKEAQWLRDEIDRRIRQMRNWVWMNAAHGEATAPRHRDPQQTITLPLT